MNRKSNISMGPGASSLILIFVMLSLSVLAMLGLTGSYNDVQLSKRSAAVTEQIYTLYENAEQTRAAIGETLSACRKEASSEKEFRELAAVKIMDMPPLLMSISQSGTEHEYVFDGDLICWEEKDGAYTLECAVSMGDADRNADVFWARHNLLADRAQMEDEWEEWD